MSHWQLWPLEDSGSPRDIIYGSYRPWMWAGQTWEKADRDGRPCFISSCTSSPLIAGWGVTPWKNILQASHSSGLLIKKLESVTLELVLPSPDTSLTSSLFFCWGQESQELLHRFCTERSSRKRDSNTWPEKITTSSDHKNCARSQTKQEGHDRERKI